MALEVGTKLSTVSAPVTREGSYEYSVGVKGVTKIIVGKEYGVGDYFHTAEIFIRDKLVCIMPLHALEHYELIA